ncbi:MAG TPA: glycosyltransferase [Fluviicola sp.]|nr:glycosyltransferase [Fluviicola sp.]
MRKKVLFLCSWYPNKNAPTLGNFVQKHAEAASLHNDIFVLTTFSHFQKKYIIEENIGNGLKEVVVYYPKVHMKFFGIKQIIQFYRTNKALKLGYNRLFSTSSKPDLIHLNQVFPLAFFALKIGKKNKLPIVITENSTAYHLSGNDLPKWALKYAVYCMKKADLILPVSKDLGHSLKKLNVNVPMEIIPNVVDEQVFGTLVHKSNEKTVFLHVSTANDNHKNVSGIIRTIKELSLTTSNFLFIIISDGELTDFITLAYETLNIPKELLNFEGRKSTAEIAQIMNRSDVFVLFSNYENLPCVILEALTVGIPVISTNVNGVPECVNESNGILINPKKEDELYKAMLKFIQKEVLFDNTAIKKDALSKYSYSSVGLQLDEVYQKVIK